ncbi:MAG TPA: FliG C-terminal domain-containing protein [Polyangiales bacterium]|nr:FliG C-terminal domain-containing protein [Polyangiales bacterium]
MTSNALTTKQQPEPAKPQTAAITRAVNDIQQLTGAQKGFLLLISLEEQVATRILGYLSDEELKVLRKASEQVREVSASTLVALHKEFASRAGEGAPTTLKGGSAYLKRLAGKAFGEGRAQQMWSEREDRAGVIAQLERLEVPTLLGILEDESAQTVSVILAQFDATKAAEALGAMTKERRGQVLFRMAKLEAVPEAAIREIEEEFAGELKALSAGTGKRKVGGVDSAASVMKRMKGPAMEGLLETMQDVDAALTDQIKRALFTFEDLSRISGRGIQTLLKEIATDQLLLALRTASDDMREKIFGNVSSRAAAMLREELEMMGPTKLSDVEGAQRTIVERALQLEAEGQIRIEREGTGDYV